MKIIRPFLDSDPLTLSPEEFNNNDIRTEQFINNEVNQGNLLKAIDKKTGRREGVSICLLVFSSW